MNGIKLKTPPPPPTQDSIWNMRSMSHAKNTFLIDSYTITVTDWIISGFCISPPNNHHDNNHGARAKLKFP